MFISKDYDPSKDKKTKKDKPSAKMELQLFADEKSKFNFKNSEEPHLADFVD